MTLLVLTMPGSPTPKIIGWLLLACVIGICWKYERIRGEMEQIMIEQKLMERLPIRSFAVDGYRSQWLHWSVWLLILFFSVIAGDILLQ